MPDLTDNQRESVQKLLLTPIEVSDAKSETISRKNGVIISSGSKYKTDDPDMSDFAIGFYEIIYDLKPSDFSFVYPCCEMQFAGDTMNTSPKKVDEQYHFLANFWVLPCAVGRTGSGKYSRLTKLPCGGSWLDRVDFFLFRYQERFSEYQEAFPKYVEKFGGDIEIFCEKHFVPVAYKTKESRAEYAANAQTRFHERAELIAKEKAEALYGYFRSLELL